MGTDSDGDTGLLDETDRRKARDVAAWLIGTLHRKLIPPPETARLDPDPAAPAEIRDLAAAIRDLDVVASGRVK